MILFVFVLKLMIQSLETRIQGNSVEISVFPQIILELLFDLLPSSYQASITLWVSFATETQEPVDSTALKFNNVENNLD
jgi:hypothetical protein